MNDIGLLRIPGARPIRRQTKNPRQERESSWDNRFHLGRIPDYNPQSDKHLRQFLALKKKKKLLLPPSRKEQSPKSIHKSTSNHRIRSAKPPVVKTQVFKKLMEDLKAAYSAAGIPEEFQSAFVERLQSLQPRTRANLLVKELQEIKQEKSLVTYLVNAISTRESSLHEIQEFSTHIRQLSSQVKTHAIELLSNLRVLTVQVVEAAKAWKEKLINLDPKSPSKPTVITWQNQNYLEKIKTDQNFLKDSNLGKFFEFSDKEDPFLIHPSIFNSNARAPGKFELPIPSSLLKRIRKCEALINHEQSNLSRQTPFELRNLKKASKTAESQSANNTERAKTPCEDTLYWESIDSDIENQIAKFSEKVPEQIQASLGKPTDAYTNALSLRYPGFLFAKRDSKRVGLIILNLEVQKSLQKRLHISHFSAVSLEELGEVLKFAVEFIWENYPCVEVRINMISQVTSEGKYESDKDIKGKLDALGFRWKQMTQSGDNRPAQILGLRRPQEIECTNSSTSDLFGDSLELAYGCTVQIDSVSKQTESEDCSSMIGVACALKALGSFSEGSLGELIKKMPDNWVPPAFRFRKEESLEGAMKDLVGLGLQPEGLDQEASVTSVSCSALGISWGTFYPTVYQDLSYTRVFNSEINVMRCGSNLVYMVPTEDPNFNVLIVENENKPKELFKFTQEIMSGVEKVEEVIGEIWIPSFQVEFQKAVSEAVGKVIEDQQVSACYESLKLQVKAPMHPVGSYTPQPQKDSCVIKKSFVFGIMHNKVYEQLEVPFLAAYVNTSNFINAN